MATDAISDFPSEAPTTLCHYCREPMPTTARFCGHCGAARPGSPPDKYLKAARQTVIEQGELVAPDLPPRPARPFDSTSLRSLFPSGPLFKHEARPGIQHVLWEQPARPRPADIAQMQTALLDERGLPSWLAGASQPTQAVKHTTPNFLRDAPGERKSGPIDGARPTSDPLYTSDPTLCRVSIPPLPEPGKPPPKTGTMEPYPPLPDGTIPCKTCGGTQRLWGKGTAGKPYRDCPDCLETPGRVKPGTEPTPAPQATAWVSLLMEPPEAVPAAAETTGPTDVVLEIVPPASLITEPLPETRAILEQEDAEREVARQEAARIHEKSLSLLLKRKSEETLREGYGQIARWEVWEGDVQALLRSLDPHEARFGLWNLAASGYSEALHYLKEAMLHLDQARGWMIEAEEARHASK